MMAIMKNAAPNSRPVQVLKRLLSAVDNALAANREVAQARAALTREAARLARLESQASKKGGDHGD
jgi:hypothetical protein